MRLDTRPRHRNSQKAAVLKRAPGYLAWLRGRECIAANGSCAGKIEAAHVDYAGDKGLGTKASDRYAVPLCSQHHYLQHNIGWTTFERTMLGGERAGLEAASFFWNHWPGRHAWEAKHG